ncbi:MAG: bifunctional hydroxymethylpyrimidine kinase/phosphomethylpyrimidine kinase, partial [Acidimicrobiales bacterium]
MAAPGHLVTAPGSTPPVALTIAATDSGGGAGIAADLRTFAALGVMGTFAVTAVTAQNTLGVQGIQTLPVAMVVAQIESVVSDLRPAAGKTGMLATAEIVQAVTVKAAEGSLPPLVVDPVLVSSSASPLFEGRAVRDAYLELFARAAVVTPNLPEAALLVGRPLRSLQDMEEAAWRLQALGPGLVVVKGGRLPVGGEAVDVAVDGHVVTLLRAPWVETRNVHGTGCSFAAAIAANLALGREPLQAALAAKAYVYRA